MDDCFSLNNSQLLSLRDNEKGKTIEQKMQVKTNLVNHSLEFRKPDNLQVD